MIVKLCGDSDPIPRARQKKGRAKPGQKVFRRGCLKGTAFVHRTTERRKCNNSKLSCINRNHPRGAALLDSARAGDATRIFIGAENKLFALSGSSVIARPFRGPGGQVVGVVGVIGPTRLNYARVVPMVDFTAQSLGKLIG